jgi:uncharacterized tellurite resistance protein B-like protein
MALKQLLERLHEPPPPAPAALPFAQRELAVAALLVEAAQLDHRFTPEDRALVARLVRERFKLPQRETEELVELASGEFASALDDWVFTQAVRAGFSDPEREAVLQMMWEVVYADGQLARLEQMVMARIPAALGVAEGAAEAARERAYARTSGNTGTEE